MLDIRCKTSFVYPVEEVHTDRNILTLFKAYDCSKCKIQDCILSSVNNTQNFFQWFYDVVNLYLQVAHQAYFYRNEITSD